MKILRLILIALFALCSAVVVGQNVLQINNVEASPGDEITVEVVINNTNPFVGFQFDLPLPLADGFVYPTLASKRFRLNPARVNQDADPYNVSAAIVSGNVLRIIVFHLANEPFLGNSGVIGSFKLATTGVAPGTWPLVPVGPTIGNAGGTNILTSVVNGQIRLIGTTPVTYAVSGTSAPSAGGSISGTGSFAAAQAVTLTATPAAGYLFSSWAGLPAGATTSGTNGSVASFSMPASAVNVTANFSLIPITTYALTTAVVPAAGGSVTGAGSFAAGASVTLTATPAAGYRFVNFSGTSGVLSTVSPYTFNMPANNLAVTANFELIPTFPVTVAIAPTGAGTVVGQGTFAAGTNVTLAASANTGFAFKNFSNAQGVVSTNATYSFVMPSQALNLTANYEVLTQLHPISFTVDMTGAAGFNPATATVHVAVNDGSTTKEYTLTRVGTTLSYTASVDLVGGSYNYKYLYKDPVTNEWPVTVTNRTVLVDGGKALRDAWGTQTYRVVMNEVAAFVDATSVTMDVEVINSHAFTGFQFDIAIPAGFVYRAASIAWAGRQVSGNHQLLVSNIAGGIRVLGYTADNTPFRFNSGKLISFVLDLQSPGVGVYPVNFAQAIVSNAAGQNVTSEVVHGKITISNHSNVLRLVDTQVLVGATSMIVPISITNTQSFTAFQTDITLPAGFTYVANSVKLTSRAVVGKHSITASMVGGKLRVAAYSTENVAFTGNSGAVATIELNIPLTDGVYPAPVSDAVISNAAVVNILTGAFGGILTINPHTYIIDLLDSDGWANRPLTASVEVKNTGTFNGFQFDLPIPAGFSYIANSIKYTSRAIADHVITATVQTGNVLRVVGYAGNNANYLGNDGVLLTFDVMTSDVAGAYNVTVDNSVISHPVLPGNVVRTTSPGTWTIAHKNLLIIKDATQKVDLPVTIHIEIDNTRPVTAFQVDIPIPLGFVYVPGSFTLTDRKGDHSTNASIVTIGGVQHLRLLASSATNQTFAGFNGNVASFVLIAGPLPATYNLVPTNTILSSPAALNIVTGTVTGVVTLTPDVRCPANFAVCVDAAPITLTGRTGEYPAGGIYSGNGVNNNIFTPAVAGVGDHLITYTYTYPNLVAGSCMFTIKVNPLPVVTCPAKMFVCLEAAPVTLTGGLPSGGIYSGKGVTAGRFSPAIAGSGLHVITYTFTDDNGCVNSCNFEIHVYDEFKASIAAAQTICFNTAPAALTSTVSGGKGNYTYQWLSGPNATTLTNIAGATSATYQPAALSATTVFVLEVKDECGTIRTASVTITVRPDVTVAVSANQNICFNAVPAAMTATAAGGTGTYTYQWWTYVNNAPGTRITGATSASYTPAALAATSSYVVEVTDACKTIISAPVTINVAPRVTFTFTHSKVCINWGILPLTGGLPAGGTYSGPGVTNNQFNVTTAGVGKHVITYTYTHPSPFTTCPGTATFEITVDPCTGIPEVDENYAVTLYPSPTDDKLFIGFNGVQANVELIRVFDIKGNMILKSEKIKQQEIIELDMSRYSPGIYTLQLFTDKGVIMKKFVVK